MSSAPAPLALRMVTPVAVNPSGEMIDADGVSSVSVLPFAICRLSPSPAINETCGICDAEIVRSDRTDRPSRDRNVKRSSGAYWFKLTVGVLMLMLLPTKPVNDGNSKARGCEGSLGFVEKIST